MTRPDATKHQEDLVAEAIKHLADNDMPLMAEAVRGLLARSEIESPRHPDLEEAIRVQMVRFGEIPDRNSPDDFPEGYVLTREEIIDGFMNIVAAALATRSARVPSEWIVLADQRPEGFADVLAVCISTHRVIVESAIRLRQLWADAQANSEECAYTHWQHMPEAPHA